MAGNDTGRRVVVTGIGVVTSLGETVTTFWDNLLAAKSGVSRVESFDTTGYTCQIAAEIKDFDPCKYMDPKEVKRSDRYVHFAMAAAKTAMSDGGFDPAATDPDRVGVIIGSGIGGLATVQQQAWRLKDMGPRKVSPFMIPSLIANIASGVVAIEIGARGPNFGLVSACATGTHAIGESLNMLRRGDADVILAGGSEATIVEVGFAGFCAMRAMSTLFNDDPTRASRPFDKGRDGFVMGEGAGVLLLETLEHAQARGARIYCELAGYSATCDAYHITSPDPEGKGLSLCFERTLADAGIAPEEVDYVNAHGTSTPYNDKFETLAIKSVFGDHAHKLAISSTKSMTGHLLGAAGGIEAAICAKAIETGGIPPTINLENPDPECDLDYVPNQARSAKVDVALSDNLGFGGHNAAIVMRRI